MDPTPEPEHHAPSLPSMAALDDLPAKGADAVDAVVDFIQNKAVRPLTLATRAIVFGIIVLTAEHRDADPPVDHTGPAADRLHPREPGVGIGPHRRDGLRGRRDRSPGPSASTGACRRVRVVTESRQVVIIGSGPAGLTAAIYAARAQLSPLVIEGEPSSTSDQPGGQLMLTTEVENFPGFVEGVMGPELMGAFREQAARFGTDYVTAKVSRVDLSSRPFGLWVGDPDAAEPTYAADALIVATGAKALMLDLPERGAPARLRRVDVRHLRRVLLPGPGDRRGRRWRLRPRGGPVPDPVRRQGHPHPPAGRAAGVQGDAAAGHRQPEDRVPVAQLRGRRHGRHQGVGRPGAEQRDRATSTTWRCPGCSSPSVTSRTPTCSRASSTWRTTAT